MSALSSSPETSDVSDVMQENEAPLTPEQRDVETQLREAMARVVLTEDQQKLYDIATDESVPSGQQQEAMKQLMATLPQEFVDMTAAAVDELMIDKVTERSAERMAAMQSTRGSLDALKSQIA